MNHICYNYVLLGYKETIHGQVIMIDATGLRKHEINIEVEESDWRRNG